MQKFKKDAEIQKLVKDRHIVKLEKIKDDVSIHLMVITKKSPSICHKV